MTWSYNLPTGDPPAWPTPVDHVRYLVRDTKKTPQSMENEEVGMLLAEWSEDNGDSTDYDFYLIAAMVAEAMSNAWQAAGTSMKIVGQTKIQRAYTGEANRFLALARRLRAKSDAYSGRPMHGMGLAAEPATLPGQFTEGQFDNGFQGTGAFIPPERQL